MELEISDFTGCKIALFCGDKLLTILRDDKASIPWANMWELPGGWSEIWETSRTMGRCNRRNWRSSGLWIFSLYRYIIKMKAKFYEGYILYYSLHFSNLSYLSIHKYLR